MRKLDLLLINLLVLVAFSANTFASGLRFEAEASRDQEVMAPVPGFIEESDVEVEFDEAFTQVEVKLVGKAAQLLVGHNKQAVLLQLLQR